LALVRYLKPENIFVRCPLETKDAVLEWLSMIAAESGIGVPQEKLREKLFEREQTMSTGIGNGVGVPHTLVEGMRGLHAFVITLQEPIPFDAVDHKPVIVVIGLFGDSGTPNISLGALATLGRILRDEPFVQSLWKAHTKEDVYRLLSEKEEKKES
jgi:mannitol/fructose-specific phosphotransferase system IIA component (Ntr-type)